MTNTYPKKPSASTFFMTAYLADVSTAGQIYVAPGFSGRVVELTAVLNGTIATANAVLTAKIGGANVTGGVMTIPFDGSAAGDVVSCTPTGANTFTPGDAIEIETNGASTNAVAVTITCRLEPF
jgi:hypothetical protein